MSCYRSCRPANVLASPSTLCASSPPSSTQAFSAACQCPRGQPISDCLGASLPLLDDRNAASLAKLLATNGLAHAAWELFEWLRGLPVRRCRCRCRPPARPGRHHRFQAIQGPYMHILAAGCRLLLHHAASPGLCPQQFSKSSHHVVDSASQLLLHHTRPRASQPGARGLGARAASGLSGRPVGPDASSSTWPHVCPQRPRGPAHPAPARPAAGLLQAWRPARNAQGSGGGICRTSHAQAYRSGSGRDSDAHNTRRLPFASAPVVARSASVHPPPTLHPPPTHPTATTGRPQPAAPLRRLFLHGDDLAVQRQRRRRRGRARGAQGL